MTHEITTVMPAEMIQVVQLPIITEQLRAMKESVERRVSDALSLVCTEDTVKAAKTERAELNKCFTALEDRRKEVKAAILKPYNDFEAVYSECI